MKSETSLTRFDIDHYLYSIAKEYKKLNRINPECEIIIVGGASILLNYHFREETTDIDSLIKASSSIKDVINKVGDENGLPTGWINEDFTHTDSFSTKLAQHSKFYKTFCGCLNVRTVTAEYLLAMKMRSYREYKNDMSDIIGIIKEQKELGFPISLESANAAYIDLYNEQPAKQLLNNIETFINADDLEDILYETRNREKQLKVKLIEFEKDYPNVINRENVDQFINKFSEELDIDENIDNEEDGFDPGDDD